MDGASGAAGGGGEDGDGCGVRRSREKRFEGGERCLVGNAMDGATNNAVVVATLLRHHLAGCGCRKQLHTHQIHSVSSTLGVLCHHDQ